MSTRLPATWQGLVDDAAIFPPGNSALPDAAAAYAARRGEWYADLVGPFVVTDVKVPEIPSLVEEGAQRLPRDQIPVSVVVTGGAGAIAGALRLVAKSTVQLAGLEIALRDLDDPAGNARRVVAAVGAARAEGQLDDTTPVHVELPQAEPSAGWLGAADAVAEAELRLKFRTGGAEARHFPTAATLAAWIDAALDRETPFKCTAGLHRAVRNTSGEGFEQHGFLNVLAATRLAFDGAARNDVIDLLEQRDPDTLVRTPRELDLAGARRWFTSYGSCSVTEPLHDLMQLGLISTSSITEATSLVPETENT